MGFFRYRYYFLILTAVFAGLGFIEIGINPQIRLVSLALMFIFGMPFLVGLLEYLHGFFTKNKS